MSPSPEVPDGAAAGLSVGAVRAVGGVRAARRETELRTFAVPAEHKTAARSWLVHGERRPGAPRRASCLAVVRQGRGAVETLLRYRAGSTPLGAVGFPGGSLQDSDEHDCAWYGPTATDWARTLGLRDHRLARRHVTAAIRELFEESGILLAGPGPSAVVEDPHGQEWMLARQKLATREQSLAELLNRRGYGLRTDLLWAVGRWLSPDFVHRRFDTQYFVAAAPQGQRTSLLEGTGIWSRWMRADTTVEQAPALGETIGLAQTAGAGLGELTVPAVELLLERMRAARSVVTFLMGLTLRGPVPQYQPELISGQAGPDGAPRLGVWVPRSGA